MMDLKLILSESELEFVAAACTEYGGLNVNNRGTRIAAKCYAVIGALQVIPVLEPVDDDEGEAVDDGTS